MHVAHIETARRHFPVAPHDLVEQPGIPFGDTGIDRSGCAKTQPVEHVHDEVKNALAGGHLPSQHFAVNAAWFKLALLSYNIASAIKGLCFSPEERTARFKKYRLLLVHLAGRMSRFQCKLRLRLRASKEAIARVQKVWAVFALPTQATAFT